MAVYKIEVETWSGVTMDGTIEADSLFKAARKAKNIMGGSIRAVRACGETVAYRLVRPTDATRRETHGKTEIFATITRGYSVKIETAQGNQYLVSFTGRELQHITARSI